MCSSDLLVIDFLNSMPQGDSGGGNENVESAEGRDGRGDRRLGGARLGHIRDEGESRPELLHRRVAIEGDDRPVLSEPPRDRRADPRGRAADERDAQTRSSAARAAATTRSTSSSVCTVASTECSAGDGER